MCNAHQPQALRVAAGSVVCTFKTQKCSDLHIDPLLTTLAGFSRGSTYWPSHDTGRVIGLIFPRVFTGFYILTKFSRHSGRECQKTVWGFFSSPRPFVYLFFGNMTFIGLVFQRVFTGFSALVSNATYILTFSRHWQKSVWGGFFGVHDLSFIYFLVTWLS